MSKIISKIDGTKCKSIRGLSLNCHKNGITLLDYFIKYEGFIPPKCIICGMNSKQRGFKDGTPNYRKTCGSKSCINALTKKVHNTIEAKERQRINRFNFLAKKSGDTPWDRKNRGEMSYLEKWFYEEVIVKNNLFDKFDIISEFGIYPYYIDYAFLNIKLAVEMDGRCHFMNGDERLRHDIIRDENLVQKGWKVYRIKYDELDTAASDFMIFLNNIDNVDVKVYGNRLYEYSEMKHKYRKIRYIKKEKSSETKIKSTKQHNAEQMKYVDMVLNSDIDFSKSGWVSKLALLLCKRHQKINIWMKKYMPDFYSEKCFKRVANGHGKKKKYGTKKDYLQSIRLQSDILNDERLSILSGIDKTNKHWKDVFAKAIGLKRKYIYNWLKKHASNAVN